MKRGEEGGGKRGGEGRGEGRGGGGEGKRGSGRAEKRGREGGGTKGRGEGGRGREREQKGHLVIDAAAVQQGGRSNCVFLNNTRELCYDQSMYIYYIFALIMQMCG